MLGKAIISGPVKRKGKPRSLCPAREPREWSEQRYEAEGAGEETCYVTLSYDKRLLVFFDV